MSLKQVFRKPNVTDDFINLGNLSTNFTMFILKIIIKLMYHCYKLFFLLKSSKHFPLMTGNTYDNLIF